MKTEMKEININELEMINGGDVQIGDGPIDPPKRQGIPDFVPIRFVSTACGNPDFKPIPRPGFERLPDPLPDYLFKTNNCAR